MVVDFKNIDIHERPALILRNMDCVAYGILGKAFNVKVEVKLDELSTLTFDYPEYESNEPTPFYDDVREMNIIDLKGVGQFILNSAKEASDGVKNIKTCTAYSLELELSYKQFFAAKGTYNLWNPISPENTILGMVKETVPYWTIGHVDASLIGKYRTFECGNQNVLDFLKHTAQDTYRCIFTFDTYNRTINVQDSNTLIPTKPVYLSRYNLIEGLEINQETEEIYTCMEGHGADDLDIRSVNPTGTNKVYNLDNFMKETYLSKAIIEKWAVWKKLFDDRQLPYYNLTIEESLQTSRLLTEKVELTALKGELKGLETEQSTIVQYLSEHPHDTTQQAKLTEINGKLVLKKEEIKKQEGLLAVIQSEIDEIAADKSAINKELSFDTVFTPSEVLSLNKYIKEGAIQDSSYVVSKVKNYNTADESSKHENASFGVSGAVVTRIANKNGKELYSVVNGKLTCPCGDKDLSADVVRGTLERKTDGAFVLTAYLNKGKRGNETFPSGNISVTGMAGPISTDVVPDTEVPDAYKTGTQLTFTASTARVFFTQNATEYEARAVQFELYEYVKSQLKKTSRPNYSFALDSANFLAIDDFIAFKDNFTVGAKVYLDAGRFGIMEPLVIGATIDYKDISNFTMEFSNKFSSSASGVYVMDILRPSMTMGKKFDKDQYSVGDYRKTGAATAIDDYINNALDVAKQEILATVGQAISWDENGLRARKWNADRSGYEPQQMWMNNNQLLFTDDYWNTVKTAFGKVRVGDGTMYGLIAEVLMGTIIGGNNLNIASAKEHGGVQEFLIDGAGVRLYNGRFYLTQDGGGKILIDPAYGIMLGTKDLFIFNENDEVVVDKTKANMWLDLDGSIHLLHVVAQGDIIGSVIKGSEIYIGGDNTKENCKFGVDKAGNFIGLETLNGKLKIDAEGKAFFDNDVHISGSLYVTGDIHLENASKIFWGANNIPNKKQFAASTSGPWHPTMQSGDIYCCDWNYMTDEWGEPYKNVGQDGRPGSDATVPKYITETVISKGVIEAPRINANQFGIYPTSPTDRSGAFTIHGMYMGTQDKRFWIDYFDGSAPYINVGANGIVNWKAYTDFYGCSLKFDGANINWGDNAPTAVFG